MLDGSAADLLTDVAGRSFGWQVESDRDGNLTVVFADTDAVDATEDPPVEDVSLGKNLDTFGAVTVKGSNRSFDDEGFTASETFVELNRENIVPGSETVHKNGQTFDRGDDYEMRYLDGEIRALSDRDMDVGGTHQIDYDIEIEGTFTEDGFAEEDTRVFRIPGLVSSLAAEQAAFVLVDEFSEPRWTGRATNPARAELFSGLESLTGLSAEAPALAPAGEPTVSPEGFQVELGEGPDLAETTGQLREQVGSISRRV